MSGIDARRARRWFWALAVIAILAMGGLYRELGAQPGPVTALLTLLLALILLTATVQAARILTRLTSAPRLPRRRAGSRRAPSLCHSESVPSAPTPHRADGSEG